MNTLQFTDREVGTILAALRRWQAMLIAGQAHTSWEDEIASEAGLPLSIAEIDVLCETINKRD